MGHIRNIMLNLGKVKPQSGDHAIFKGDKLKWTKPKDEKIKRYKKYAVGSYKFDGNKIKKV